MCVWVCGLVGLFSGDELSVCSGRMVYVWYVVLRDNYDCGLDTLGRTYEGGPQPWLWVRGVIGEEESARRGDREGGSKNQGLERRNECTSANAKCQAV